MFKKINFSHLCWNLMVYVFLSIIAPACVVFLLGLVHTLETAFKLIVLLTYFSALIKVSTSGNKKLKESLEKLRQLIKGNALSLRFILLTLIILSTGLLIVSSLLCAISGLIMSVIWKWSVSDISQVLPASLSFWQAFIFTTVIFILRIISDLIIKKVETEPTQKDEEPQED